MNTGAMWQIVSSNSDDTLKLGESLGQKCRGGEVFWLRSDLGGGKTTFVKGLAKGLGSKNQVSSPSFTISRVYECRHNLLLYHFDFYRLEEAGVVEHELAEALADEKAVVAIEWGEIVDRTLPIERIEVKIAPTSKHENERQFDFKFPANYRYLFDGLKK